ncbi:hypothetical protein ACFFK0_06900 [Paenibacillus chartarius]|uniref:Spore coat protein n=1 Tax=Paenibacillus chartarius TaxID=747481 RepID=A0ABV6DHU0_9BACL
MNSGIDKTNGIDRLELLNVLEQSLANETELLRTYVIAAERIHENEELKERLQNFAEGNAKRSRQLQDEIRYLKGE